MKLYKAYTDSGKVLRVNGIPLICNDKGVLLSIIEKHRDELMFQNPIIEELSREEIEDLFIRGWDSSGLRPTAYLKTTSRISAHGNT